MRTTTTAAMLMTLMSGATLICGAVDASEVPALAALQGQESTYEPAGRRDPFVNPLATTCDDLRTRPPGLSGQRVGEVRLQGLTQLGNEPIAILLGVDGIGYFGRVGDELWDGRVATIDFDAKRLTFEERVSDPVAAIRYRTVVRELHPVPDR